MYKLTCKSASESLSSQVVAWYIYASNELHSRPVPSYDRTARGVYEHCVVIEARQARGVLSRLRHQDCRSPSRCFYFLFFIYLFLKQVVEHGSRRENMDVGRLTVSEEADSC